MCARWSDNPGLCCLAKEELNLTECFPQVGISSCDHLISDEELQVIIWIVAASCVLFNAVVAWWRITEHKARIEIVIE